MLLLACSCNFLKVDNIGKSTIESYFAEISSLEPAVNGLYNLTYSVIDKYYIAYEEIAGDCIVLSPNAEGWQKCQDYKLESSDEISVLGYLWKYGYEAINNANQILKYAPKLRKEFPDEYVITDKAMGNAYFIRALTHLYLCSVYGQNYTFTADASHLGVINMDHIPSLSETIKRSSCKIVYQQIISDLKAAIKIFPSSADYSSQYFANPAACHALLARVYLYMADYKNAIIEANQALSSRDLVSREAYRNMFVSREPKNDECYLRINGKKQGSSLRSLFYYQEPQARPSSKVMSLLTSDDVRSTLFTYKDGTNNIVCKYNCEDDDLIENLYYSPVVIRASEMYLIRAEANCALGNLSLAADDVKALQARALGKKPADVDLSYSSSEELEKLIEQERIKELCFEGHRFMDIARRHKNVERPSDNTSEVKTLSYPDYRFILQIPSVEIEANPNMQQNPTIN